MFGSVHTSAVKFPRLHGRWPGACSLAALAAPPLLTSHDAAHPSKYGIFRFQNFLEASGGAPEPKNLQASEPVGQVTKNWPIFVHSHSPLSRRPLQGWLKNERAFVQLDLLNNKEINKEEMNKNTPVCLQVPLCSQRRTDVVDKRDEKNEKNKWQSYQTSLK